MSEHKGYFEVACCKRRRGLINGVLVCSRCDYTEVSVMPNENLAKDVPDGTWFIYTQKPA